MKGMAYIRAKAKSDAIEKVVDHISGTICVGGGIHRERVTTKVAKRFLIKYPTILWKGDMYSTFTRSIGAGVHEIFVKPFKS